MKRKWLGVILCFLTSITIIFFSSVSLAMAATSILINNNAGIPDTVEVNGLLEGDIIKVYVSATGGKIFGTSTVAKGKNSTTLTIAQLGTGVGYVYLTVSNPGKAESDRIAVPYDAETQSDELNLDAIVVSNNAGIPDTVAVTGLSAGAIIKVYSHETAGKLLATSTVAKGKNSVTLTIAQLGTADGYVYVSVSNLGQTESIRVEAYYELETQSDALNLDAIMVNNNARIPDTVAVTDLSVGDIIKVYSQETAGKLLATSSVAKGKNSVTLTITQLGTAEGDVYVSVSNSGQTESIRVAVHYEAEPQSDKLNTEAIEVTNNAGIPDIVALTALSEGDVIKVYRAATAGKLLATSTVAKGKNSATLTIAQLGTAEGNIYVSVSNPGYTESALLEVQYDAETQSDTLNPALIMVTNYFRTPDTIAVIGLSEGDVIKVYDAPTAGKLLATSTVTKGKNNASLTIAQLGTVEGDVYVTVSNPGKTESNRVEAHYDAEARSDTLNTEAIEVTNNVRTPDTISVAGLSEGDVIKVYSAATDGKLLATSTVAKGKNNLTITIIQLVTAENTAYLTVSNPGKAESDRVAAPYDVQIKSDKLDDTTIVVNNNAGIPDTVAVTQLSEGALIKVYGTETSVRVLGTSTVTKGKNSTTVTIAQLGTAEGTVYVTVSNLGESESDRVVARYDVEAQSDEIDAALIVVTNNLGIPDTISITGLLEGDVIKVYNAEAAGKVLATSSVAKGKNSLTITISQLVTADSIVYISVTNSGKTESIRTEAPYDSVATTSDELDPALIAVTNNLGIPDTIAVTGLSAGDVIKVYDAATAGKLLATSYVAKSKNSVKITITQLQTADDTVYLTVSKPGKIESNRVAVPYDLVAQSDELDPAVITVTNNTKIPDTIVVTWLSEGDIIKVYDAEDAGKLLATSSVAKGKNSVIITIAQLPTTGNMVYISVSNVGKTESDRAAAPYDPVAQSAELDPAVITVTNNTKIPDTVAVTGLSDGDVIKVYDAATAGKLLATSTVAKGKNSLTISIAQLQTTGNIVYISVSSVGKTESNRAVAPYDPVAQSDELDPAVIEVINNTIIPDTVAVTGLSEGDLIKVYDSETAGKLLATSTVAKGKNSVTVRIAQIVTTDNTVYLTVSKPGKIESNRVAASYDPVAQSNELDPAVIMVTNNAGRPDTVTLPGMTEGDVIKVYSAATAGKLLGTFTVTKGKNSTTVTIAQLGTDEGNVYISVSNPGKTESNPVVVPYVAEAQSDVLDPEVIVVTNYAGIPDKVVVTRLSEGDVIKVYDTAGKLLGTSTVARSKNTTTVTIAQLGTDEGNVYVSVSNPGKTASIRVEVPYDAEVQSDTLIIEAIDVTNNARIPDTIAVTALSEGDVIKVYSALTGGKLLGTSTVAKGKNTTTVTIAQLGTEEGNVYVSVSNPGKTASIRVEVPYDAEVKSDTLDPPLILS